MRNLRPQGCGALRKDWGNPVALANHLHRWTSLQAEPACPPWETSAGFFLPAFRAWQCAGSLKTGVAHGCFT